MYCSGIVNQPALAFYPKRERERVTEKADLKGRLWTHQEIGKNEEKKNGKDFEKSVFGFTSKLTELLAGRTGQRRQG